MVLSSATITAAGVVTGLTPGTVTVTYTFNNGTCSNTVTTSLAVNALPVVASIGDGATAVCINTDTPAFTNATAGGTWSITNGTGSATITAAGVVTGLTPGTVTITYTFNNGTCSNTVTTSLTVNELPVVATIGDGATAVCVNTDTPAFTNATTGGTWSITNGTGSASITTAGVVTGLTPGTVTVTYTFNNGACTNTATTSITVNELPVVAAIEGGATTICVSSDTPAFTDATAGGTWSITNGTGTASITAGGVVTGLTSGTVTVVYTFNNGACSNTATASLTVNELPVVAAIGDGATAVCVNTDTPAFTNATAGGTWSITNGTGSATITAGGVVTGLTPGTVTVVFTFNNGACANTATASLTVNELPVVAPIGGGATSICVNAPIPSFTDATEGGTWSIANGPATASITGSGEVTGLTSTTVTVVYTLSIGACTNAATTLLTVNELPVVAEIEDGASAVCVNSSTQAFTDATAGGSWSITNGTGTASVTTDGVVTGLTPGTVTVVYTFTNGTCINTATKSLTIKTLTAVAAIGGGSTSVCANSDTPAFTDATSGGTWSVTNGTGTATITSGGVVTGLTPGTVTIVYTFDNGTCTNSAATSLTVNSPAVITVQPSGTTFCAGSNASFSVTAICTGTLMYKWQVSTDGITFTDILGAPYAGYKKAFLTVGGVPVAFSGNYYRVIVSASGPCSAPVTSNAAQLFLTNTWTGVTSTDWNNASNWSGKNVPTIACPDVVIPGGTANQPVVRSAVPAINNLIVKSGAVVTIDNGSLIIGGAINNTAGGIITTVNGSVEFNGSAPQTIPAAIFQNNALKNLIISNSSVAGLTLGGALDVYQSVTYGAPGTNLNTGGFLTLKSTVNETASLGNMTGHTISGDVTVERFIATGTGSASYHAKAWELIAVPTQGQTIKQSWQEGATATNASSPSAGSAGNPKAGYGTMLTSDVIAAATQSTPGFDVFTSTGPSIKTYNFLTDTYLGPLNTDLTPIYNQKGWFLLIRGDRSVYTSSAAPVPTVLRTKGTLFTPANLPPVTNVVAGKSESVGNPYASAIDLRNITRTGGVAEFVLVYDPRLGGSNSLGAFQTLYLSGGNYYATPGGGSYGPGINNYIQSGQAFLVQATGTNGTVSFTEDAKVSGSTALFTSNQPKQSEKLLRTTLYGVIGADGSTTLADGVINFFDDSYSNGIDVLDAKKSTNTRVNLSIVTAGKLLAVERRHTLIQNDTIFLRLTGGNIQNYRFEFNANELDKSNGEGNGNGEGNDKNLQGFVEDNYLHTRTQLDMNGTTIVDFSIENIAGSYAADRFRIVFSPVVEPPVTSTSIEAYGQESNINVEWKVKNIINVKQYDVEKSINGKSFTTLIVKTPTKNKGTIENYSTADNKPSGGFNYYRIRTVDVNGKVQYTSVVKVFMGVGKPEISIYPNPITNGVIKLHLTNLPAGQYGIRLLNKLGQVIVSRKVNHAEGSSIELINWDYNLAHGMYQLEINQPDGTKKNLNVMY